MLGATFVARSFSGDKTQLVPLIKAAIQHQGAAFLDVLSPCIAFNNHAGSTKSFDYVREHNEAVNYLDVMIGRDPITLDQAAGSVELVEQHDGSILKLRKLSEDYDPTQKVAALNYLQERHGAGEIVTGLLYVHPAAQDMHAKIKTSAKPLNTLGHSELCPGSKALEAVNAGLR
jgi:2-oxoglutarate ferredoxin oxidoreductase subunit beta